MIWPFPVVSSADDGSAWLVAVAWFTAPRDFEEVEYRFAPQARVAVLLVLLSGLYMLYAYNLWDRFTDAHFWWMHLMVGVWLLFAVLLFV